MARTIQLKKQNYFWLSVVLISSGLIGVGILTNGHDWGDDFASYIMQARSISDWNMQDFIKHNAFTIQKSDFPIGPIAYPWGYPLLLAPIYKFSGMNLYGFKSLNILFFLAFLVCFYFLLVRKGLSPLESLLLSAVFAFNPELLRFQDNILSDIPFLFFSTLSILLIEIYVIHKEEELTVYEGVVIGLAVFAAFFIRTNGSVLLLTLIICQVFSLWRTKRYRSARTGEFVKMITPSLVFILLAVGFLYIFPSGQSSYLTSYKRFSIEGLKNNLFYYLRLGTIFFSCIPANNAVYGIFSIFFVVGFVASSAEDVFLKLYFLFTLFLFVLWPQQQGLRFVFPILPIFLYFGHKGIKASVSALIPHHELVRQWLPKAAWIPILALFCYSSSLKVIDNLHRDRQIGGPFDHYSLDLYAFLKHKTPEDSVIVFFKPRALRMMTDRDAVMVNRCEGLKLGDYLVLDSDQEPSGDGPATDFSEQISKRDMSHCHVSLTRVYENMKFTAFKISASHASE